MKASAKYAAFISYAHADEAMARRIHNALETYRLPKSFDQSSRAKLKPIFRDVTELTAHHSLSEKIRDAVKTSRFLIVLCSPAAKNSHWVNEEIQLFRKLHGENKVLSVIIDGNPETSFPQALTEGGREPLAANMTSREGFRFGVTQLAASMIGVGLDELVQRDNKRRRKRLQWITTGALLFSAMMGVLSWTAWDARLEAETSRNEAENLVEFLITDLKDELSTLGRTSILNDLGRRITEYYDAIPLSDMDEDRLARQAETRHLLGQVALDQGDLDRAESEILAAFKVTEEILRRSPNEADVIFDHAQSAYWVGLFHQKVEAYDSALEYWSIYRQYGQELFSLDPRNKKWIMEAGYGNNNVANIYLLNRDYFNAKKHYELSVLKFEDALTYTPNNSEIMTALANALGGLSKSQKKLGLLQKAKENRKKEMKILKALIKEEPLNILYEYELVLSSLELNLLELTENQKKCSYAEALTKLETFTPHLVNDPENENYRIDYTHFRHHIFKTCYSFYSSEEILSEAKHLIPLIEKHSPRDKTQQLDFVNQIILDQQVIVE